MKFSLKANAQENDGFSVSFSADGKEERETIEKIMENLIAKISVIEIKVQNL